MTDFHTRLAQARRSAGWTQAQLTEQMNVSRQTVSHWETGRMQPDEAALQRLTELFHELEPKPADPAARKPLFPWLIAAAVLCAAVCVLIAVLQSRPKPDAVVSREAYDLYLLYAPPSHPLEWYQQPAENEPDKAYVNISFRENRLRLSGEPSDVPSWYVNYFITEENGIPITLNKQTMAHWDADGNLMEQRTYVNDELLFPYPSRTITSEDTCMFSTCIDVCGARWFTLYIEGVDAKGNELSFGGCVELLDEIEPAETRADYRIASDQLSVTFDPSPVISFADDYYDRGEGFEWISRFTNTGNSPLTITHLDRAWFNGEDYQSSEHFSAHYMASYWQLPAMTIEPGESIALDEGMPIQYEDFTHIGYRVTAVDEEGNEYQAADLNEFILREGVVR